MVQVVTDKDAAYKAAGAMLMETRKKLFWTPPCAAHCLDLNLEDFEKKLKTHRVTIKKVERTQLISTLEQC